MKVYVLLDKWGEEIKGVYSSRELAEKDMHPTDVIMEWEVDSEVEAKK